MFTSLSGGEGYEARVKMFLLILITVLCGIMALSSKIAKPIQALLKRPNRAELETLREIGEIKKELAKISIREQYTEYVKTERKIVTLEKRLTTIRDGNKIVDGFIFDFAVKYAIKGVISFILLIISICYRYEPVVVFDQRFNFDPFGWLIRFPTGIEGAVSVPFWIFISSFTLRSITSYLKI